MRVSYFTELDTYVETKDLSTAEIIDDDRRVSTDDEVEFGQFPPEQYPRGHEAHQGEGSTDHYL